MGVFIAILGAIMTTSGMLGDPQKLVSLLQGDFADSDKSQGFGSWLLAILIIGSIGFFTPLRGISRAFLALVVVVILVSNKGLFASFQAQTMQNNPHTDKGANVIQLRPQTQG